MSIFRFRTLVLVSALLVAVSTYSMAATLQVPQDHLGPIRSPPES